MELAVSAGAAVADDALVDGADGADATAVSTLGAGAEAVEVGAAWVFNGARLSELVVDGLWVVAVTLAAGGVERGAAATLERLALVLDEALDEVFATLAGSAGALDALLRAGVGEVAASATFGLSRVSVTAGEESLGAGVGAASELALLAVCVAGSGALTTLSLRL